MGTRSWINATHCVGLELQSSVEGSLEGDVVKLDVEAWSVVGRVHQDPHRLAF